MTEIDPEEIPPVERLPTDYRMKNIKWIPPGCPRKAGYFRGEFLGVAFEVWIDSDRRQTGAIWSCAVQIAPSAGGQYMRAFGIGGGIPRALNRSYDLVRQAVWVATERETPSSAPNRGDDSIR